MNHYIEVIDGTVVGYVCSLTPPSESWIEMDGPGGLQAISSPNRFVWANGELLNTGQPKVPPHRAYVWDSQVNLWVDPRTQAEKTAEAWATVRTQRNQLLAASDWTDTFSAPARLGQTLYGSWQTYRQALRDVTQQPDPFNITWPQAPN